MTATTRVPITPSVADALPRLAIVGDRETRVCGAIMEARADIDYALGSWHQRLRVAFICPSNAGQTE